VTTNWTDHYLARCDDAKSVFEHLRDVSYFSIWDIVESIPIAGRNLTPPQLRFRAHVPINHYRNRHAKETGLSLVRLGPKGDGLYSFTDNPDLINRWRRPIVSEIMTWTATLDANTDISIIQELYGEAVAVDVKRLIEDLERHLRAIPQDETSHE